MRPCRFSPPVMRLCSVAVAVMFATTVFVAAAADRTELAFPGAVGWAAHTPGGRDGKILRVTTLAAGGPGSFAEAVNTPGPRIIVFEVGGVIDLDKQTLRIKQPFLTIAGQTAPSPGITFIRGGMLIDTHDVVVQHIRVRPGEAGHPKKSGWEIDGLSTLQGARNIIVDHCSFTWAVDENLSVSGKFFSGNSVAEWRRNASQRVTFSHNIIAEGLNQSTHKKGAHSKGTLLMDNSSEVLVYGNLYANNVERNPQIKGGTFAAVINNFIYNPQSTAIHYHMTDVWRGREIVIAKNEIVGNVLRHGPNTPPALALFRFGGLGDLELHTADNLAFDRTGAPAKVIFEDTRYGGRLRPRDEPIYWPPGVTAMPASQVQAYVCRQAGARPWDRDAIDARIVRQADDGTGWVIDSEQEVGGYPVVAETRQPFDPAAWDLRTMTRRTGQRTSAEGVSPVEIHEQIVTGSEASYRIPIDRPVRNRTIRIANVGNDIVVNPRVIANGRRDWFSTPDILAGIIKPDMTDREKALAIWRFLVENRYHDGPAHPGVEMHDPVRFLNVYGYGFCDDSAVNFAVLAGQAGLKARVWGLSGHVVPEAWFEDGWRMLDPDGEIYYLEDDGHAIAGVRTLERRPDLIAKYPSPYYKDTRRTAEIYTSADDNKVNGLRPGYAEAVHTLALSLRPGESLIRHHDNWGLYFNSHTPTRVPRNTARHHYGNGRFVFEPAWADGVFARGAERAVHVRAERGGDGWVLHSDGGEACLGYRFAGPYPYLDGSVKIVGDGHMAVAFSEDGTTWMDLWTSPKSGVVDQTVPLAGVFRTRVGRPVYAYHLKLTFGGHIRSLRFTSDIQVAPASLPALEPGANTIRYRDDTGGGRRVAIAFGYDFSDGSASRR